MTPAELPRMLFRAVIDALRTIGQLLASLVQHVLWIELREGMLDLSGIDRRARAVVWLGLGLLVMVIAALVTNGVWRGASDLVLLDAATPRGLLAPRWLFPGTLFLLAIAWTFALTGALHARREIRGSVLLLYLLNSVGWLQSLFSNFTFDDGWYATAVVAQVAIIALFVWRGGRPARPTFEFGTLFVLVSIGYLLTQYHALDAMHRLGIPTQFARVRFNVNYLNGLVLPLVLFIGVDIAEFVHRAAHWTTITIERYTTNGFVALSCLALLVWRWWVVAEELQASAAVTSWSEQGWALLGAAGEVGLVGGTCWLIFRTQTPPPGVADATIETVARYSFPVVVVYQLVALAMFVVLGCAFALPSSERYRHLLELCMYGEHFLRTQVLGPWHYVTALAALGVAIIATLRRHPAVALYFGSLGVMLGWELLTRRSAVLGHLHWEDETASETCWLVLVSAASVIAMLRRQFRTHCAAHGLFVLVVLMLLRQRDFIENPFTPMLGSAGAIFVAFGLLWDLATHGRWANGNSASIPRTSRLFLYLGYVLLAATVMNWAVATHDLASVQKLTGGTALLGFDLFGKPLLYVLFWLPLWQDNSTRH